MPIQDGVSEESRNPYGATGLAIRSAAMCIV
jgi:hypothetical protein